MLNKLRHCPLNLKFICWGGGSSQEGGEYPPRFQITITLVFFSIGASLDLPNVCPSVRK